MAEEDTITSKPKFEILERRAPRLDELEVPAMVEAYTDLVNENKQLKATITQLEADKVKLYRSIIEGPK